MTSIKKSLGLISTTLLIASVLSVSSPYAVYAEDSQPDKMTAETKTNQVNVDASMRGNEPYIDATIATEQPVSQSAQATVMLQDANGNTITSWVYTMTPGQRRFTAWFDLTGLKSNDYRVAVSVQDKEALASGQSTAVHFDQTKAKKSPASNDKKTTTPNQNNQSTASTITGGQQSNLASGTNGNANQQVTRTTQGNTSQKTASAKVTSGTHEDKNQDTKMLADREEEKTEPKKGFPWLLSGLVAVVALSLFLVIQKVAKRK
ncbi:hypothetical membrane associated protein [Streptococcus dysgalactiae subsp. dysgalactiae]|uniref:Hypothetical membrane associated protein n=1 Tax=Streptococcus dysgalactiae subsp. dysgalactiae TaxID=99822 RepID=A0A380JYH3_STRDY|nr:hypothetical protein [Streptococcus dysgalactiae]MCB2833724.1 hypothetical protein [Streptococcus dysgalactiae subsp. dysgalactiae]MCB2841483.1 hypothetical protein [Streptococcus dysgalactiae subsp. dysgalactiae]MCB2845252.1 hypothetical protein [Streptococcus dysgalactiae subsp. dysgalactiae]SUN51601.1 hypothetical membrane associated protein [Streptococcus dysgalactiae subsp. dysgalactiae]